MKRFGYLLLSAQTMLLACIVLRVSSGERITQTEVVCLGLYVLGDIFATGADLLAKD